MPYYTFRLVDSDIPVVECAKWEENSTRPEATYRVQPLTNFCNCPAMKRDCRHVRLSKILLEGFAKEMFLWRWDERSGWKDMRDIPSPEEMVEWLNF